MKNFQDFCDSLDQEFIDTLKSETSYVLHNAAAPENIFLSGNFATTMRILERYHEWLHLESENAQ